MSKAKKEEKLRRAELSAAAGEISSLQNSLNEAYVHFNNATDSDALDACIFEISALRSRYNTALKQYRQRYY
jgi:uncharacterized protein YecE (DUF72 family)